MEITKTKDTVFALLQQYPCLRDNDERLIVNVWANDMARERLNPEHTSVKDFFTKFNDGKITNADSITRARRQIQEKTPELRGQLWHKRHKHQKAVKEELGYR